MLHIPDPLSSAFLVQLPGDEIIQRRQVDVRKPRAGIIAYGQVARIINNVLPFCRGIHNLIDQRQESFVFDVRGKKVAELPEVYRLVKTPDVQLHKEFAVSGAHPLLHTLSSVFNAAPRKIPAGVPVHFLRFHIFNGKHCHPLDDMVL